MQKRLFVALTLLAATAALADSATCPPNYAYSGYTAPAQWAFVSEWQCGPEHATQSPIDISGPFREERNQTIGVHYQRMPLTLMNSGHDYRVVSTRRNTIEVGGVEAVLDNVHIHTPAEHTLDGAPAAAGEMHFVHVDHATHAYYVIAVPLVVALEENAALRPLIDLLPLNLCAVKETAAEIAPLLPAEIGAYYRYVGSLTTPPCSGGVTFFVVRDALRISEKQRAALHGFGANARPLQPRNGRVITRVLP